MSKKQRRRYRLAARRAAHTRQRRRRILSTLVALAFLGTVTTLVAAPGEVNTSPGAIAEGKPPDALEIGAGDGTVSGKTGAYTHSIPIAVPPGRLGVQPSLALTYSSQQPLYGGIAAGWSLDIPTISRDWSRGRFAPERWQSSMAGRELIETTSVEASLPAGWQGYRAQSDSSQARYQRVPIQVPAGTIWQVLQSDGTIMYFGEQAYMSGSTFDDWMPLTRQVDPFGNEIHYYWQPVVHESQLVGFRPQKIEYTINSAVESGAPHARVIFGWAAPDLCGTRSFPLGAKMSYRSGARRIEGYARLDTITTQVADGAGGFRDVRQLDLGYNISGCPAAGTVTEAPLRQLETVTERAWSPANAPGTFVEVVKPTITFAYGASSGLTSASFEGLGSLMPLPSGVDINSTLDPLGDTAETMMLDIDGDSLVDIVYSVPSPDPINEPECHIAWRKNLGINASGNVAFGSEALITMPTLPWENQPSATELGTMAAGESCSLGGQHTLTWDPWKPIWQDDAWFAPPAGYLGAILVYSFRDVNGDGLVDLLTAVERDSNYFAPQGFAGGNTCIYEAPASGPWPTVGELSPEDKDPPWANPPQPESLKPYTVCGDQEHPWNVHVGTGSGFADVSSFNDGGQPALYVRSPIPLSRQVGEDFPETLSPTIKGQPNTFSDFDGDGYSDFLRVYFDNSQQTEPWIAGVYRWNGEPDDPGNMLSEALWATEGDYGSGQSSPVYPGASASSASGGETFNHGYASLTDVNGDGLPDIVRLDATESNARIFWNTSDPSDPAFFKGPLQSFDWISLTKTNDSSGLRREYRGLRDLDNDGLPDRFDAAEDFSSTPHFGLGEGFLAGATVGFFGQKVKFTTNDEWLVVLDRIDVTGDGIPDIVSRVGSNYEILDLLIANAAGERRGVLKSIDNGRGLSVAIDYAPHTDASVVTMGGARLPSVTWVVKSVTATHAHGATNLSPPPPATTSYLYDTPVWSQDPDGRWGFRGFETVTTTGPSGARTEERYTYNADWSGRLGSTLTFAAGASNPTSITDTIWDRLRHVPWGLPIDFFFPVLESSFQCEQLVGGVPTTLDEASCRSQAPERTTLIGYAELESGGIKFAFARNREITGLRNGSTVTGKVTTMAHDSLYTAVAYRIAEDASARGEGSGTWNSSCILGGNQPLTCIAGWSPTITEEAGYTETHYNTDLTLVEMRCEARDPGDVSAGDVDETSAPCTAFGYDTATGLKTSEKRPEQVIAGPAMLFDYTGAAFPGDGKWSFPEAVFQIAPVTVTNELGHIVHTHTDLGTGATRATYGPNVNEGSYQVIDGFGRPTESWISIDSGGGSDPYLWKRTGVVDYLDSASPQQMIEHSSRNPQDASYYTTQYNSTKWAEQRMTYDGAGRVIEIVDWDISNSEPDGTRRFQYDASGNLDLATSADPRNGGHDDSIRVTYDFTYDSLGRRACAVTPDGTGVATIHGGYETIVTELVPDGSGGGTCANHDTTASGPRATRTIERDIFDRVIKVTEATTTGADAVTEYAYDGNDNVERIDRKDPTLGDVVTAMTHDWVGNRKTIVRDPDGTPRTWTYEYTLDGNLASQTSPAGGAYATTYLYDAIGRMQSKDPGLGGLAAPRATELAVGATAFSYDDGANGIGRPTGATLPFGTISMSYDAWGNLTGETRTVDLSSALGVTLSDSLTTTLTSFTSDGKPGKIVAASGTTSYLQYAFVGWKPQWVRTYHNLSGFGSSYYTHYTQSYNAAGQPKSITQYLRDYVTGVTHTGRVTYFTRDENGRVIQEYSTDPSGSDDQINQIYTFTGAGEVATLFSRIGGATDYRSFTFDYDDQHQLTGANDNSGYASLFTYSPQGRLMTANIAAAPGPNTLVYPRDVTYVYDDDSEPAYPDPDLEAVGRLDNVGGGLFANFRHDINGNLTYRTLGSDIWNLEYDGEDRLRVRVAPDGAEELYYYHDNQRWLAIEKDSVGTVLSARLWFGDAEIKYDCVAGVCSRAKSRTTIRLGGRAVGRFERDNVTGAQDERLLHTNGLGHLLGVYRYHDGAGNLDYNLEVGYQYGPFGEVLDVTEFPGATTGAEDYTERFNGKELDEASGLSYYGYRYFDPLSLTWNRADPLYRVVPDQNLIDPRRSSLYGFSMGNPIRYIDPDGRQPKNRTMTVTIIHEPGNGVNRNQARLQGQGITRRLQSAAPNNVSVRADIRQHPNTKLGRFMWRVESSLEGAARGGTILHVLTNDVGAGRKAESVVQDSTTRRLTSDQLSQVSAGVAAGGGAGLVDPDNPQKGVGVMIANPDIHPNDPNATDAELAELYSAVGEHEVGHALGLDDRSGPKNMMTHEIDGADTPANRPLSPADHGTLNRAIDLRSQ